MITATFLAMLLGAEPQMAIPVDCTVKYYRTFSGYSLPLKLIEPFTKEEALCSGSAYYIGHFDQNNMLIKIEKMHKGKLLFTHVYGYYPNGSIKRLENTPAEGKTVIKEYDERGKSLGKKP